jgi:PKHD-type hydroxylase
MFNRYAVGQSYGGHVDATARQVWATQQRIRTDLSATLFLSSADEYDGGELVLEDVVGHRGIKLPAGDLVLYPSTSVHRVEPVTRGVRVAAFFWVQSMVREDTKRSILFDIDTAMRQLGEENPEHKTLLRLSGAYFNLLRLWSDT